MLRIRQVKSFLHIKRLNDRIFPGEPYEKHPFGIYWVVYDDGKPVGFCGIHPCVLTGEPTVAFCSRSGILKKYRGKGLGGRMLDVRLRKARQMGMDSVITYTIDNISSANNLISRGFRIYDPESQYGGKRGLHWIKEFIKGSCP